MDDWVLVYIAKRLNEAKAVEKLFADNEIEYDVEPDTYSGGLIFQTQRTGAFFYVETIHEDKAREVLSAAGYKLLS